MEGELMAESDNNTKKENGKKYDSLINTLKKTLIRFFWGLFIELFFIKLILESIF